MQLEPIWLVRTVTLLTSTQAHLLSTLLAMTKIAGPYLVLETQASLFWKSNQKSNRRQQLMAISRFTLSKTAVTLRRINEPHRIWLKNQTYLPPVQVMLRVSCCSIEVLEELQ